MKFKNVKVGQTVKVKKSNTATGQFYNDYKGVTGVVYGIDSACTRTGLTVYVCFEDGEAGWGNHKDLKLVKDVEGTE